jgi:hypothetical protein
MFSSSFLAQRRSAGALPRNSPTSICRRTTFIISRTIILRFALSIGGYNDRFPFRTYLQWESLTRPLNRIEETIVLNSSGYGPAFDDFYKLLTDGDNMQEQKRIGIDLSTGVGPDVFEQGLCLQSNGVRQWSGFARNMYREHRIHDRRL